MKFLPSAWPKTGRCDRLGNEPLDGRSLSLSDFKIINLIFKKNIKYGNRKNGEIEKNVILALLNRNSLLVRFFKGQVAPLNY